MFSVKFYLAKDTNHGDKTFSQAVVNSENKPINFSLSIWNDTL